MAYPLAASPYPNPATPTVILIIIIIMIFLAFLAWDLNGRPVKKKQPILTTSRPSCDSCRVSFQTLVVFANKKILTN